MNVKVWPSSLNLPRLRLGLDWLALDKAGLAAKVVHVSKTTVSKSHGLTGANHIQICRDEAIQQNDRTDPWAKSATTQLASVRLGWARLTLACACLARLDSSWAERRVSTKKKQLVEDRRKS